MGLIAQAPIDTLFAPPAAMPGAATPVDGTAGGDLFAALLASLTGESTPDGEGATAAAPVPTEAEAPLTREEQDETALSAAVAALQLLPQLTPILPGPLDGGQQIPTEAEAEAAEVAPVAETPAGLVEALPPAETEGTQARPLAGTEPRTAEEVVEAAAKALPPTESNEPVITAQPPLSQSVPATPPAATPPAEPPAPVAAATVAGALPAGSKLEGQAERTERKDARKEAEPPTEAPPGGPPDIRPAAERVVRFDGNADTNQGRRYGQSNTPKEANQPNASVQGIAHAAANSAVGELRTADAAPVAEAPQPAAPQLPEPVQQVATTVIERVEQGGGDARLHLNPEALGEVTLHIHTDGDQVRVEIHAQQSEAANLLRDHTQDLSQLLGERGLNLTDVHVDLGWEGARGQESGQADNQRRQPRGEGASFASLLGLEETGATERHNRLRSAYNPDGAHSYRV